MSELVERIRGEFDAREETLHVGDLTLSFWRPESPDSLLDDETLLQSHDELAWHPYWAEAWEASFGVAEELLDWELNDMHVLDLGCGLGLTGTVAAARGARVVMADFAPPALLFAEVNSDPWRDRVTIVRLDWRKDRLDAQFDLIIGSDILYDREDLPYLDAFWHRHLAEDGCVLLGEPSRLFARELVDWIRQRPWRLNERTRTIPPTGRQVRLLELRQPAAQTAPQPD